MIQLTLDQRKKGILQRVKYWNFAKMQFTVISSFEVLFPNSMKLCYNGVNKKTLQQHIEEAQPCDTTQVCN